MSGRTRKANPPKLVDSVVTITSIGDGGRVRLSITAPDSVKIYRDRPPAAVDNSNEDVNVNLLGYCGNSDLDFSLQTDQLPETDLEPLPDGKRPRYLAALLDVPKDSGYDAVAQRLEQVSRDIKREVAARLLPVLKDEMRRRPHESFDDKKILVKWVNDELRRFGLAIKSPKSDRAATLSCNAGNHPEEGRFRLASEDNDGRPQSFNTPRLSELLDNLVLIDAPTRREALAEWHGRAGRPSGVPGRG